MALGPGVRVDVREMTDWAHRALDPRAEVDRPSLPVVGLSGELLPGWYDDWVIAAREAFRQLRLHALETLCLWLIDGGSHALAVQAGQRGLVSGPSEGGQAHTSDAAM